MIDVHAHVLPGLDDGASDMDEALAMCRMAHEDGVRAIVATPHFHRGLFETPSVQQCRTLCDDLQQRCRDSLDPRFSILLGSDCHVHAEILDNLRAGTLPTLNGSRYLLLELPDRRIPAGFDRLLFDLRVAGARPVITHPERQKDLSENLDLLQRIVEQGAYAQVTAGSLTGEFGSRIQAIAEEMVGRCLVQVIASDTHDTTTRPPRLSAAREVAAEILGREVARWMVDDVPGAMVEDDDFEFPPPRDAPPRSSRRRRPWWKRLLGM